MRVVWSLLTVLALLGRPAAAQEPLSSDREIENALLHRAIDLSGLQQWQRARQQWRVMPAVRAQLLVVNLWARSCPPCLAELPTFRSLIEQWRGHPAVQFMLIADPPTETSPAEVSALWQHPVVALPPGTSCQGVHITIGDRPGCVLQLPEVDPLRAEDRRPPLTGRVERRPLTLLVDRHGTIRQVFAGSVEQRKKEIDDAIHNLLKALTRENTSGRAESVPARPTRPL